MKQQLLDYLLVPAGLVLMATYHLWLLLRIVKQPTKTVIGVNAIYRRLWVESMMEDPAKNGILAVQTLRNNLMASTMLASTSIMLSSLIAVILNTRSSESGAEALVLGDKGDVARSIKFFSILLCFLLSFLFHVESIRYYSHAGVLVTVPPPRPGGSSSNLHHRRRINHEYIARAINRGGYFWSLGLRAIYFSFPLLLWVFGPIPMFLCCIVMVVLLYFLDVSYDSGLEDAAKVDV